MDNDIEKRFKNRGNTRANQKLLGMREGFRGVVVKEWVAMPNERTEFPQHNKTLVEKGVSLHS